MSTLSLVSPVMSLCALGLSLSLLIQDRPAHAPREFHSLDLDPTVQALQQQVRRLEAELAILDAVVTSNASSLAGGLRAIPIDAMTEQSASTAPHLPANQALRPNPPTIRFSRFVTPPAVDVQQDEDGNLSFFNRDPTLTGQRLVVLGIDDAGQEVSMRITIPAPMSLSD